MFFSSPSFSCLNFFCEFSFSLTLSTREQKFHTHTLQKKKNSAKMSLIKNKFKNLNLGNSFLVTKGKNMFTCKGDQFYRNYFLQLDLIESGSRKQIMFWKFCQAAFLLKALHFTSCYVFYEQTPPHWRALQFDIVDHAQMAPYHALSYIGFLLLAIFFVRIFYFENRGLSSRILRSILLKQNNEFFLTAGFQLGQLKVRQWNKRSFVFLSLSRNIAVTICRYSVWLRAFLQLLFVFFSKCAI